MDSHEILKLRIKKSKIRREVFEKALCLNRISFCNKLNGRRKFKAYELELIEKILTDNNTQKDLV